LFTGTDSVEVKNQMHGDTKDQDHQNNDDPIQGMFQDAEINDVHAAFPLCARSLLLLIDSGYRAQHGKANRHHKHNSDPVSGVPRENDTGRVGHVK
jgi:hypothetical protein